MPLLSEVVFAGGGILYLVLGRGAAQGFARNMPSRRHRMRSGIIAFAASAALLEMWAACARRHCALWLRPSPGCALRAVCKQKARAARRPSRAHARPRCSCRFRFEPGPAPRQYIVRSASVMELTAASSASTLPEPPSSSASIAASMPSKPSFSSAVSVASFA